MRRVSTSHIVTGSLLVLSGAALVAMGLLGSPLVPPVLLAIPGATVATVVGGVLLFGGLLAFVTCLRRDDGPPPSIPAHVAFSSRQAQPEEEPLPLPARPSRAPSRAPPPAVQKMEAQIRDLTREINKAGVMLATGKLSRDGYTQYVEDLKRQRAQLEAAKVDLEIAARG